MVEYKEASFFTEFFKSHGEFNVIEEFKVSEDEEEKNLYIGSVEVLGTILPLTLRVEIPFTFPHNKLVFRTKSLSGYPHLIHTGKIKHGDWFCLNTPFAETVEEQLNQEIFRLKEWIQHQMRKDLPSVIKDANVKRALAFANAYDWENLDEVKEFSSQAMLTFVGDFHNNPDYFKKSCGHLSCIKSPDDRFYAVQNSFLSNYKLPYIIVDDAPKSVETLADFIRLKEQYGWDDKICKHLLSDFSFDNTWKRAHGLSISTIKFCYTQEEKDKIQNLVLELEKEDSYFTIIKEVESEQEIVKETSLAKVHNSQKSILKEKLNSIILESKEDSQKRKDRILNQPLDLDFDPEAAQEDYYSQQEIHYFLLGIRDDSKIEWFILYTNHNLSQYEKINYDLCTTEFAIERLISQKLFYSTPQFVSEELFFGRGSFCRQFQDKKIALIGLGAIGSMVADSLARSGIKNISLWDDDFVVPGNICRSSYKITDLGNSKVDAISNHISAINPFLGHIKTHGYWFGDIFRKFVGGSFYANVNYNNQKDAVEELEDCDLVIDCTGSNEMLHFLSYAVKDKDLISMCITNHANDLLCITNKDGNPFELRKAYLSRIEQDTKNFYIEGGGCYSPTFLANNCDIASIVNLALRDINKNMEDGKLMHSSIYSYSDRGIVSDRLSTFKLEGYDIRLTVSSETLYDAEDMEDSPLGDIGYLFGSYSRDGKQIMITHIVDSLNAKDLLTDAYATSKGLIDYIGDYRYSGEPQDSFNAESFEIIASKAEDDSINTNNPLLAVRNPNGSVAFFLYINNELVKFTKEL